MPRGTIGALTADLITIAEARRRVLEAVLPLPNETVAVQDSLDRVLSQDVAAAGDLPAFPSSAMDGYALAPGPAGRTLTVAGESRAGAPAVRGPGDGEAIRISTGAAVPASASAVIRQEDTELAGERIRTRAAVKPGDNVRQTGEDQRAGETVLGAGTRLGPAELGAAVGAGVANVVVRRAPRIAVLCTGDELRPPGETLGPGEIHNSNAPMLAALARRSGAVVVTADRVRDERAETERALAAAMGAADVVVVSGGVSVGPHDHVKPALAELGVSEQFWGVALQPGKPTWFGALGEKLIFGLPGNPVSAVVTFTLFVAPALAALQGEAPPEDAADTAELASAVGRNRHREQAVRVRLERKGGRLRAIPNGAQGSHLISSLLGADALALIPAGDGEVDSGTPVHLVPLPR